MSADIITEKYANSLFEVSASTGNTLKWASELESVALAFADKTTLDFFTSPFNSPDHKMMVAKSSLEGKVSAEVFNFIVVLVQNERLHLIAEINQAFKVKASQIGGQAEGTLFVVTEPAAEFVANLEAKISSILNKKVQLKTQTDKTLISGFKVQVEGWTLDDSAAHHLKKLTEKISTRGL